MANKIKGIFEPFSTFVSQQLSIRKEIMYAGSKSSRPDLFFNYTTQKSCVLRLSSGVNIKNENEILDEDEKKYTDNGLARHWVLEGGIYDEERISWTKTKFDNETTDPSAKATGSYNPNTKEWEYSTTLNEVNVGETANYNGAPRGGIGKGGAYGDSKIRSDKDGDFGIVPMPGIIDATVRTKSDDGSLREAEINFICHNRRQLEILETLYMRPGYVLMLEWGWNPYISNDLEIEDFPGPLSEFFSEHSNFNEINKAIRRRKIRSGGNYDAIVGYCKNFAFKANESGGYECKTEIIAQGELMESLKSEIITLPSEVNTDDGTVEDGEIVDMFLYLLKCIDENLRKAGDSKYIKLLGTDDAEDTYWEKTDWEVITLDILAGVASTATFGQNYAASLYLAGRYMSGGFDTEDNLADDKLEALNFVELKYVEGFQSIVGLVQKILRAKTSDLEHDAKQTFDNADETMDPLLFGTIIKETAKLNYHDYDDSDSGERKNIYVRWDLLCEMINKFCTPLYKASGDPVVELTYQTPFAQTEYANLPGRVEETGSNGHSKHSYLNYTSPRKNPLFNTEDHRILGQSFDNRVCIMPHQDQIRDFIMGEDYMTIMGKNGLEAMEDERSSKKDEDTDSGGINDEDTDETVTTFRLDPLIIEQLNNEQNTGLDRPGLNAQIANAQMEGNLIDMEQAEWTEEDWREHYEGMIQKMEPLTQDKSVQYGENSIGMVYFNLDHLISKYEEMRFDLVKSTETETKKVKRLKEKFSFFDYLTTIWDDVNDACGGYYDFTLHTEHERPNVVRVLDMTYQGSIDKNKPIFQFEPQGLKSIARDFYFDSKIDADFASTVSIAAQSPNNAHSLDAMSFKSFHKNIYNRFTDTTYTQKQREEDNKKYKAYLESDLKRYKKLLNRLKKHQDQISRSNYIANYSEKVTNKDGTSTTKEYKFGPEKAKAASREIGKLLESINQRYPLLLDDEKTPHPLAGHWIESKVSLERNAIIPLEFNIQLDGISGIIPLNVFKIQPDRLPLGYQRDDIVFIVKQEDQKITAGGDWTAEFNGQLTLLDIAPNKEGKNPIPEDVTKTKDNLDADDTDEKTADEIRSEKISDSARELNHTQKIKTLDPSMQSAIEIVVQGLEIKGWQPKVHFAHRTIGEQKVILANGASTIPFSFHNAYKDGKPAALAVDIIDKRYAWGGPAADLNFQFWKDLGSLCEDNGLDWGGRWTSFPDVAHCETPNMTVAQARNQSKPDIGKTDWEWIQSKLRK